MKGGMNRFFIYALMFLGMVGVLNTILVSAYSGMNTGTLFPGIVGGAILAYLYIRFWIRKGKPVVANSSARRGITILAVLGIIVFIAAEILILSGTVSDNEVKTDYVVILGGGLKDGKVTPVLQERLLKGIQYLENYPEAAVIVSGGLGFRERITEAEAMESFLLSRGIAARRIIREDKATSTMENFLFTRELLQGSGAADTKRITVVTSDFHMLRSKLLARRVGFEPYGITSSTPLSVRANCYIREFFALIKSFFLDRV